MSIYIWIRGLRALGGVGGFGTSLFTTFWPIGVPKSIRSGPKRSLWGAKELTELESAELCSAELEFVELDSVEAESAELESAAYHRGA